MNNIEIERKFLVLNEDYKQLATSHYTIQQGYICKEPDRTVRVRIRTEADGSGTAYLTIKSKPNAMGFSRFEWETESAVLDAQQLMELCLPGVIHKTRWLIHAFTPFTLHSTPSTRQNLCRRGAGTDPFNPQSTERT